MLSVGDGGKSSVPKDDSLDVGLSNDQHDHNITEQGTHESTSLRHILNPLPPSTGGT